MALAARHMRKCVAWLGTLIFLGFLLLPTVDSVFHVAPQVNLMENEPPFVLRFRPDLFLKSWYKLQRGVLEKRFGMRPLLVRLENLLDAVWLRSTSVNESVIVGQGDWLFLSQENKDLNVVADYRGTNLFTPEQLRAWTDEYAARRDWLAARGIRYLVLVAPNKHTVYPEYLPKIYNKVSPFGRTDQLVAALTKAGVEVLDLRPTLLAAKAQVRGRAKLYYRTDAHWTPLGAHAGYVAVVRFLEKWFPGISKGADAGLVIDYPQQFSGELGLMLALGDKYHERKQQVSLTTPRQAVALPAKAYGPRYFQPSLLMETGNARLPKALVFRDSFVEALYPFLSEHFSRVLYLWPFPSTVNQRRYFDRAAIEEEKPNLVVDAFVERYFTMPPAKTH